MNPARKFMCAFPFITVLLFFQQIMLFCSFKSKSWEPDFVRFKALVVMIPKIQVSVMLRLIDW
jgi:hypothetical protein